VTVLPFPGASGSTRHPGGRKSLLRDLRVSGSPVVVDLSGCPTLNHEDVELLLECMAHVAGRDTQVLFVAGSPTNRVLLEVTRIAALVPVFNSVEEAFAYPEKASAKDPEEQRTTQAQGLWSA
jgi:hypothetical protein